MQSTKTKERPILFSAPMVNAILGGNKTQTRRIVAQGRQFSELSVRDEGSPLGMRPGTPFDAYNPRQRNSDPNTWDFLMPDNHGRTRGVKCPYGSAGDRLWVRETWRPEELPSMTDGIRYRADDSFKRIENTREAANQWVEVYDVKKDFQWRPTIFMPRWASRIDLEVVSVCVERLQSITESDAIAEGINTDPIVGKKPNPIESYKTLWNNINGHSAWEANPYVWIIEFKVIKK